MDRAGFEPGKVGSRIECSTTELGPKPAADDISKENEGTHPNGKIKMLRKEVVFVGKTFLARERTLHHQLGRGGRGSGESGSGTGKEATCIEQFNPPIYERVGALSTSKKKEARGFCRVVTDWR